MEQCLTDRGKTHEKKNFGTQNWVRKKSFRNSFKFASSVFYDIAQDSSLGQCVPPSRAEISKKKKTFCGSNKGLTSPNSDRNDLFYSNIVKLPVKLACFI